MENYNRHIAKVDTSVRQALVQLNELAEDAILFIVDSNNQLIGSLTDGDLRRGFIDGLNLETSLEEFIQKKPKYIEQGNFNIGEIIALRKEFIVIFPVLNSRNEIIM